MHAGHPQVPRAVRPGGADQTDQGRQRHRRCRRLVSRRQTRRRRSSRPSARSTTTPARPSTSTPSASATAAGRAARTATSSPSSSTWRRSASPRPGPYSPPGRNQARREGQLAAGPATARGCSKSMRWAQGKYQHCLLEDPIGEAARASTSASRKLSGKTVRDFGLGFAPSPATGWCGSPPTERDRRRGAGRGRADRAAAENSAATTTGSATG